jgi:membrane protein
VKKWKNEVHSSKMGTKNKKEPVEMVVRKIPLQVAKRFFNERYYDQSAQTAYYFMLSFIPFLMFVFSLIRFLPINHNDFLEVIEPYAPKNTYTFIQQTVDQINSQQPSRFFSYSLIASFWIASVAVQSLVRSLNDAYHIRRRKSFLRSLVDDFVLTFGLMVILTSSLFVPIMENIVLKLVNKTVYFQFYWYPWWYVIRWGIGTVFLFGFFLFFYHAVPSKRVLWKEALPGAIFATIGWQGASIGYAFYVSLGGYTKIYGPLGSIIVLLIWFYLTATVVLIGGLMNATILEHRVIGRKVKKDPPICE